MKLEELYKVYKKYLYLEDTKRIDVVLAIALSSRKQGIPLWLFLVGSSGDMKSAQLNALLGCDNVYRLHNLTSKSLVNGYPNKKKHPDLAPELHGKLVTIPDMAQILKLPPSEKAELWGQLRDLFDGFAGKISGQGSRAKYKGLYVSLIAGSTNVIDSQILIHADLGTRELIYRTLGNKNKDKVMDKCIENENFSKEMKENLKEVTTKFLNETQIKDIEITKDIIKQLKEIAIYVSLMRATAEFDYSGELRNIVYPEQPTRIIKQLKRLFICLMSLDDNYSKKRAFEILWHVAESSAFPLRSKIFKYIYDNKISGEFTLSEIAKHLKIGKKTIKRECSVLENINLIEGRQEEDLNGRTTYHWRINERDTSKNIKKYVFSRHQI